MTNIHEPQSTVAPHLQPHLLLRPGQNVHVNRDASWLHATVTRVAPRTVAVHYPNPGTGAMLSGAVRPWAVRPADGAQLRPARKIVAGDQVIFGTRIRIVAAGPVERCGWLQVEFTDGGEPALVMPGAVLRLVDHTPLVTINGQPLTAVLAGQGRVRP